MYWFVTDNILREKDHEGISGLLGMKIQFMKVNLYLLETILKIHKLIVLRTERIIPICSIGMTKRNSKSTAKPMVMLKPYEELECKTALVHLGIGTGINSSIKIHLHNTWL